MPYREKRNIEASYVDKILSWLTEDSWSGISVVKSRTEAYEKIPSICVEVSNHSPVLKEIGNYKNIRYFTVNIRIFADNDGQRLDLSDWLFYKLEETNINYYIYTITNGAVSSKILSGKLRINRWIDDGKELTNTEDVDRKDKFRHILRFEVNIV